MGGDIDRSYEKLYAELLGRAEQLHESNKRRIRRGLILLVILPVILGLIRWITDSDKIVFLIIWVLIMFVLSAYLITVEYMDDSVRKTLEDVTDQEAEFDELILRPEVLQGRLRGRIAERRAQRAAARTEEQSTAPAGTEAVLPDASQPGNDLPDEETVRETLAELADIIRADEDISETENGGAEQ